MVDHGESLVRKQRSYRRDQRTFRTFSATCSHNVTTSEDYLAPSHLAVSPLPSIYSGVSVEPAFHPSSPSAWTTVDRNDEGGRKDVNGLVLSLLYKSVYGVYGQVFAVDVECRTRTVNRWWWSLRAKRH